MLRTYKSPSLCSFETSCNLTLATTRDSYDIQILRRPRPIAMSFSNTDTGSKPADPYTAVNKDDSVSFEEKVEALSKFVTYCKFCMMTTRDTTTQRLVSRCMAYAAKETGGMDLLFFTNIESNKTDEIKDDPHVNIAFQDATGQWASISGSATVQTDRDLVKKHYNPTLKAWMGDLGDGKHDGSENDPRIGLIRVKMDTATYSISDKTIIGKVYEVAKGTVTGEVAAINKIREISEMEVQQWRTTH